MSIDSQVNRSALWHGEAAWHPAVMGTRHMIVAGHYLASQAGFQILEAGGNAIDAGVAAGVALSVVQSDFVNFAGVAPMMIRLADTGEVTTIDGLGVWPRAAVGDPRQVGAAAPIRLARPRRL